MACRSSEHETTGETPNAMMFGREIRLPVDLLIESVHDEEFTTTTAYAQNLQDKLACAREIGRETSMRAQKRHYDRDVHVHVDRLLYDKGSVVWLHNKIRKKGRCPKLTLSQCRPFVAVEKLSDVVYKIQKKKQSAPQIIHADRLKPCHGKSSEDCGFCDFLPRTQEQSPTAGAVGPTTSAGSPTASTGNPT